MHLHYGERAFGRPDLLIRGPPVMTELSIAMSASAFGPAPRPDLRGQSSADPLQRVVAQFGQQLAVRVTASGEAQTVHALLEVRDLGLVLPARAIAPAADLGPLQTGCSGSWPGRR